MYGINVIYTMKPGKREEFLAGVTASGAQAAVRGEEGCLQYDYFTSVDNPDKLLLLEKWTTREAQKVHMGQPHMALIQEAKDRGMLIDASFGRRTRSVVIMDTDHVILSAIQPEVLAGRAGSRVEEEGEELP